MPTGDQSVALISERTAQAEREEVREEVRGARERWEGEKEEGGGGGRSRRKRKVKTRITCSVELTHRENDIQTTQQFYSVNERSCEVDPAHQLQDDNLQHEMSSKRQRLDGYDAMLPLVEHHHGYEDGNASDVMTGNHHHGNIPDDHHGNLDTMPGEEIEAVMRRQQAEVTELLAKSGEALSEGIAYEAFFPIRIDEMLKATQSLEQSLLNQKQAMKDRLQAILGIL